MNTFFTFLLTPCILFICMNFHRILIISFRLYFLWPLFAQGYWLETIGNSSVKSNLHPEWGRDGFLHIWLVKSSRTKLGWEHGSQYQFLPQAFYVTWLKLQLTFKTNNLVKSNPTNSVTNLCRKEKIYDNIIFHRFLIFAILLSSYF